MIVRITQSANLGYAEKIISLAGSGALIKVYTAPMPAAGADPDTAVLLGTITGGTVIGTAANIITGSDITGAKITFAASTPDSFIDENGTVAWVRVSDSTGAWIMDLDVTRADATPTLGALTMLDTVVYQGGILALTNAELSIVQ